MKNLSKITRTALIAASAGAVAGCSTTPMEKAKESQRSIESEADKSISTFSRTSKSPVTAQFVDEYHIVGKKFDVEEKRSLPSFFREHYSFNRIDPVTFSELVSYINKVTNARVNVTSDAADYLAELTDEAEEAEDSVEVEEETETLDLSVDIGDLMSDYQSGLVGSELLFSVNFDGTLEDFLNHIMGRVNLSWDWKGDHIEIYHVKEKTFVLDTDLSEIQFSASMTGGSGSSQAFGLNNEMGGLYEEIQEVLSNTVSPSGKFSVSKQLSTVTVLDTPMKLKRVERYIDSINKNASKQIMMRVQVMDIESDHAGDYGIDWDATFGNSSRVAGGLTTGFLGGDQGIFDVSVLNGPFSGSSALINALTTKSNVSTSVNTNIHTSNGRPVPLNIGADTSYIRTITRVPADTDGGSDTYTPEPDNMQTGFMLNILPRISSKGDISMTMALDISDGYVEEKILSDGGMLGLPQKTHRSFIQRAVSKNGQPVMLAGFERDSTDTTDSRIGDKSSWLIGGRQESSNQKVMTVVLITPYVVK